MRNLFKENYTGPRGPHLNHLTEITITGTYTPGKQKSVHSTRGGEYLARGRGKNTCAPRNLLDPFFPDLPDWLMKGKKYHVDPKHEDWLDKLGNFFGVPK